MGFNPNSELPLATVLDQLRVAADKPFEIANPIPAALNHSQAFFEHEQKTIFTQEWICLGREDDVTRAGDYLTATIAEVPVLVVRQQDGSIRAFVNACAHRFACLVPAEQGSAKKFTCRYHAWTYACDGELIRAPGMEMKSGFDISQHRLRPLPICCWEGFIFVSLADEPANDLQISLQPFRESVVGRFDMAAYQTVIREQMSWPANWKNLIENFTESYHVPVAHGKTFAKHNKPLGDYICGEDSDYYGYHRAAQPSDSGPGAAHPDNRRLEGEWRRMMIDFCIFPGLLVTLMPDYLWYISVQPDGPGQFKANWGVAIPPEVRADIDDADFGQWVDDFKHYMEIANEEDRELIEALHQGSKSPKLPGGCYHPIERNLWQFMRYLARVTGVL
ncbi:MAG: choline monooxygenase [Planctomycetota bacterium]|jgi:choline monooxygenase